MMMRLRLLTQGGSGYSVSVAGSDPYRRIILIEPDPEPEPQNDAAPAPTAPVPSQVLNRDRYKRDTK
jgi:hypothetical protein